MNSYIDDYLKQLPYSGKVKDGPIKGAVVLNRKDLGVLPTTFRLKIVADYMLDTSDNTYGVQNLMMDRKSSDWIFPTGMQVVGLAVAWVGTYLFALGTDLTRIVDRNILVLAVALVVIGAIIQGLVNIIWPLNRNENRTIAIFQLAAQQVTGNMALLLATLAQLALTRFGDLPVATEAKAIAQITLVFAAILALLSVLAASRGRYVPHPKLCVEKCDIDESSAVMALDFDLTNNIHAWKVEPPQ